MKSILLVSILLGALVHVEVNAKYTVSDEREALKSWSTLASQIESNSDTQLKLATVFSAAVLERMKFKGDEAQAEALSNDVKLDLCVLPIISNVSDHIPLGDLSLIFPSDSESSGIVNGNFFTCDTNLTGMASVKDCVKFVGLPPVPLTISLGYAINTGTVGVSGVHSTAMELLIGLVRLTGFGDYGIEISNGFLDLEFTLQAFIKGMNVTNVTLDLGFDEIRISSGESNLNGIDVDWDSVNRDIKGIFDILWPFVKPLAQILVRDVLSSLVKDCLMIHLIPIEGLFLQCLPPNLLANTLQDAGLSGLASFDTLADGGCTTPFSLPPEPTTEAPITPLPGGAGTMQLSYMAVIGFITAHFLINHHRRA